MKRLKNLTKLASKEDFLFEVEQIVPYSFEEVEAN